MGRASASITGKQLEHVEGHCRRHVIPPWLRVGPSIVLRNYRPDCYTIAHLREVV